MMFDRMGGPHFGMGVGPDMMYFRYHGRNGLALVQLSKDLGEYFGTSEGMLVIRPPADSASPLTAGTNPGGSSAGSRRAHHRGTDFGRLRRAPIVAS